MKQKISRIALVIVLVLLTGTMSTDALISGNQVQESILLDLNMGLANDYVDHDPIIISSNADFVTQGWLGSGTAEDPYVIEGLNITGGPGGHEGATIKIRDTNASLIIRDCYLEGTNGLFFDEANNVTVTNNTIIGYKDSIFAHLSNNLQIDNNTLVSIGRNTIRLETIYDVIISNNIMDVLYEYGIYAHWTYDVSIENNYIESVTECIYTDYCANWSHTWNVFNRTDHASNKRAIGPHSLESVYFDHNLYSDYPDHSWYIGDLNDDSIGDFPYKVGVDFTINPPDAVDVIDYNPLMHWSWETPLPTTTTDTTTTDTTTTDETTTTETTTTDDGTTNGEATDDDDQLSDAILGVVVIGAVGIIILLALWRRR